MNLLRVAPAVFAGAVHLFAACFWTGKTCSQPSPAVYAWAEGLLNTQQGMGLKSVQLEQQEKQQPLSALPFRRMCSWIARATSK